MSGLQTANLVAIFLIIATITLIYRKAIKPYQEFRFYEKIITSSYKTLVHPFSIIGIGTFRMGKKDL